MEIDKIGTRNSFPFFSYFLNMGDLQYADDIT